MNTAKSLVLCIRVFAGFVAAGASLAVVAVPFEVAVSPSRFILSGKSSSRVGQSIEIQNLGAQAIDLLVRTVDWTYSPMGEIGYKEELLPNSCRPWVTLERKTVKVAAASKRAFRFQVDVPADAARSECRFMLTIEGIEPAQRALAESAGGVSLTLPVSARMAIPIYVAVNGAEPKLAMGDVLTRDIGGKRTPVVVVRNSGDAHGRLEGGLDAVDGEGVEFELEPENSPIMPGQTRTIPLSQKKDLRRKAPAVVLPYTAKGTIDWERGSFKVDAVFK